MTEQHFMTNALKKTPLLGITGSIGSGKSAVCAFLQQRFSFPVLSADLICRKLLEKENEGWRRFIKEIGRQYLDSAEEVDREHLRAAVFVDSSLRLRLEAILHPLARKQMLQQAGPLLALGRPVLVEVPLLFEAGWQQDFDRIVVVHADEDVRLARLCSRDWMTRKQAREISRTQLAEFDKIMAADHIIDNSATWVFTLLQMLHLGGIYSDFP